MPQERAEVTDPLEWARGVHHAWNERGVVGLTPYLADDIEWHDPPELPDADTYRGRDTVASRLRDWEAGGVFDLKFDVEGVRPAGDEILVLTRAYGEGVRSGTPSAGLPVFFVYLLRDGLIARTRGFLDRERALQAAGLRE
jgi:ketosteroid isomerase-like protein